MKNWCITCSHEQSYVGQIDSYYYCERCGAKIHADGSGSSEGTREGRMREAEQSEEYDRYHSRDREQSGWNEKW
jgi:hypothetical protein